MCVYLLSCVWLFVTLWTVALQVPLCIGYFRQEFWSGLPFSSSKNILTQRLNLYFLYWQEILCLLSYQGSHFLYELLLTSSLNSLQHCFHFMFCFFWPIGMWDLKSLTVDKTHTSCVWSLNKWTTREVPWSWAFRLQNWEHIFLLSKESCFGYFCYSCLSKWIHFSSLFIDPTRWASQWLNCKESAFNTGDTSLIPGSVSSPGEGKGKPTPVFFLGKSHWQRSLAGYSL